METKLTGSEIYKGMLLHLRHDTVINDKEEICSREIVTKPNVVCIVPILSNKDVILVKQFRYAVGKDLVELPAGHIDEGETWMDAVQRELGEETGYKAGEIHPLGTYYSSPGFTTEQVTFALALNLQTLKERKLDAEEDISLEYKNMDECLTGATKFECIKVTMGLLLAEAYMKKNKINLKYRMEDGRKVGEYA